MTTRSDRWEKAAIRENARRRARDPLFAHAGLVPRTTAEEQQARVEKIVADQTSRIDAGEAAGIERAAALRAQVAARVTPVELDALDRHRLIFPRTAVFAIEHWRETLAKLDTPAPPPEEAQPIGPKCCACDWTRGCGAQHPGNCPGLRGFIYGMCLDCKACKDPETCGACPEHLAETMAVDAGERAPAHPDQFSPMLAA